MTTHFTDFEKLLATDGVEVFIVGGYVRDRIMGREVKDHDFVVTGATPELMAECNFDQVGADFPVFLSHVGDEFALARTERKSGKGYNGFTTDHSASVTLEEDLMRRDLTINAMARKVTGFGPQGWAQLDDTVIDPFGGQWDIARRVIRHVSPAFAEDPLRVLRAARFAARFNFVITGDTLDMMNKLVNEGEMEHLTAERVWAEWDKAIMEPHPEKFFQSLNIVGALQRLFPELRDANFSSKLERAATFSLDRLSRNMMVFDDVSREDAAAIMKRIKAPGRVSKSVDNFIVIRDLLGGELHPQAVLKAFVDIGLLRQGTDILRKVGVLMALNSHVTTERMEQIIHAGNAVMDTNTIDCLTQQQQATLKGAQIGEALTELRLERINSHIR